MINAMNFGLICGRLTKDPVYFENADGSFNVILNLASKRNFKSGKDHEYQSDFIEFRGFIPKGTANKGVYGYLGTGDKVLIQYTMRSVVSEKKKEKTYYQSCFIEGVQILEGRTVRENRRAEKNA